MQLLIMAAGMGSRYGGLKQIAPMGPNGEFIIDYSIYDAKQAGFSKVVFIIKEENYGIFKETIGARVEPHIPVEYVFQKKENVPEFVNIPEDREKPWGTGHAIMAARDVIKGPFAVINADDYYGPKEIPKKLKTYCLGSYHRDKYFQEVFLNAMIRDGLISNMSFCKSLEEYVLPHWRMLEVRDTETNASIQILPNGGFENGWRFNVDDATEVYVTKTCDYKKPIPVISGSQPILYDIKVGSDLTWDFLRQQ